MLEEEKLGQVSPADAVLELQVTDYENQGVEPERLIAVLASLRKLETNLARLLAAENRMAIKYLDSGSDIRIGIVGVKAVIEAMGALFLQFWDKMRFRDQDTFEKDIEALSKGLDFLTKTKETVDSGAITEEEGKILKAHVFRGVNDLVGLGVTLPPDPAEAEGERKRLIEKRSTKLLTAGNQAQTIDTGVSQSQ